MDLCLSARIDEIGFPLRAENVYKSASINYLGDLVVWKPADLFKLPNYGRTSHAVVAEHMSALGVAFGMDRKSWDAERAMAVRKQHLNAIRQMISQARGFFCGTYNTFDDEFDAILDVISADRNKEILKKYWGLSGEAPRTLESVGQKYGMTRERIRQIARNALETVSTMWVPTQMLRNALNDLQRQAPLGFAAAERLAAKYSRHEHVSVNSILSAAEVFGVDHSLSVLKEGGAAFVDHERRMPSIHEIVLEFRRETAASGCINIDRMALRLTAELKCNAAIQAVLLGLPETVWLDDGHRWACSSVPERNRLQNVVSKVLSVCGSIHIAELRQAVSKPHRVSFVPPRQELATFVTRVCGHQFDGSLIQRRDDFQPIDLGEVEQAILDCFKDLGTPLTREAMEEFCIEERGINANSFYITITYSALVQKLTPGIFGLVGGHVPVGTVEEMAANRRLESRSEHGWDKDGRLWFAVRLDRVGITRGMFFLPKFVSNLSLGTWSSILPDGTATGDVPVSDASISKLRRILDLSGADPGDVMRLSFNLLTKLVEVAVGGDELWDSNRPELTEMPPVQDS